MLMQAAKFDIVGHDPLGQIVLFAEAKKRSGTDARWAAEYRRNLRAHEALPLVPYFIVATEDLIAVWNQKTAKSDDAMPDTVLNTEETLRPILKRLNLDLAGVGSSLFDYVVMLWLAELDAASSGLDHGGNGVKPLRASGLLEALKGTTLKLQES